jgi:hypothetical protein
MQLGHDIHLRVTRERATSDAAGNAAAVNGLARERCIANRGAAAPSRYAQPATASTTAGSNRETGHEITGRQTLHRDRGAQDECQS